jgi:hypothetical protein
MGVSTSNLSIIAPEGACEQSLPVQKLVAFRLHGSYHIPENHFERTAVFGRLLIPRHIRFRRWFGQHFLKRDDQLSKLVFAAPTAPIGNAGEIRKVLEQGEGLHALF